eukprot:CAMPEP_0206000754 /NCGR_PEP_ID=MMETSP1464-20131121/1676_1 /ASSEMBLY_ACC=CAM_ASM_001124 /TAXON_ID=119497 /ORGANISM="Exanthemachrysis gayraliae, Strain RCC1523" /LENGTH=68 /DNA_ID=CAMNT_0053374021 /DNA_START=31 /DNA_END=234 /DNA_ORIENTATION=+
MASGGRTPLLPAHVSLGFPALLPPSLGAAEHNFGAFQFSPEAFLQKLEGEFEDMLTGIAMANSDMPII